MEDLEALKATIGGFHIGKNSIYSGNKKTIDSTERGIYFDSNGQSYFGDDKNFIRFFRSDKDNYKLQISADSLTFGSGVSVEKAFEDIKGDIQNAQDSADNVKDQIVSMGEQLIINGNGLMGDNTNFSALIFDASKANGSPGSFTREGTSSTTLVSDTYIPINPNLRYSFEIDAISKNGLIRMYSFLDFYDVDKKSIGSNNHMYIENTLTYLTQDLRNGDTVVHFNDLSGWNDTFTQDFRRGFIFWNYTNSFGYTYPELTYSRNIWRNLYENSNVDKTNNTITLNAPWSHGTFEAGTKLSQCNSGAAYKYQGMGYTKVPTKWTHYSGFYDGTDYSGKNVSTKFPPGTAYAKVGFLWNWDKLDDQCWVTNISLKTDYDNAIKNAQTAADTAQNTANKAQSSADKAQGAADNAQSSADKAQNTANKAQTAINNLEIGGRNLVTNSINLSDFKIESSNYTTRVISEDCCIVNRLVNHINSGSKYGIYKDIRVTAGEEYTVSCTVKEITGSMQLGLGDANMWVGLGSWNLSVGRFTCTVTAPSSATFIRIYIFGNDGVNGGSATVSNIKFEKGNRATDWTPAPEDVDAGIANAQTTADTAKTNAATAQSTADTAKANAAAAQTAADNAQSTANTAQSKADKAQGAANKAQSSANTAQNTANKAQTAADEALKGTKENAAQMAQMVTDFNGDIKNLQDQIDGNITT